MMKKETINIYGMSCASCVKRVEDSVNDLGGVEEIVINLATEKATINYDSKKIDITKIRKIIDDLGYQTKEDSPNILDEDKIRKERELKTLKMKLIVSAIFAIPLFYIAMAPMLSFIPFPSFLDLEIHPLRYALLQLLLVMPIIGVGYKFYTIGFKSLFKNDPNMDSLIAVGTTSAVLYSMYNTYLIFTGDLHAVHSLYYETAGVIITLILLGKTLESISKGKTSEAIKKLLELAPKTALIERDGKEVEVSVEEVLVGDTIIVKPGSQIPVDGVITEGVTSIDEAMLTGESMPVDKKVGQNVYAASLNVNGFVKFKATKVGADTALAQIIKLVEEAQTKKAPIAKLADVVSGYFVKVVVLFAIIVSIIWFIVTKDIEFSLKIFISILVIACPCALGLATPTAIMVGTGKGAEHGILIKSGEALELAHKVKIVVLDKTGTITEGKPKVTDILVVDKTMEEELLKITASAEKASEHPLGQAIVKEAEKRKIKLSPIKDFDSLTGRGITCKIKDKVVLIGNSKLMRENNIEIKILNKESESLANMGKTPMYVSYNGNLLGIIAVADVVKKGSEKAISELQKMGIKVVMITGDNMKTANTIAKEVGIDLVLAEVLPEDKAGEIKKLQRSNNVVAMVGDGINDALALTVADIGIAIGTGTDVAIESADIVLTKSDLMDVPTALDLSHKTILNIKQNLFWAFGYNVIGIPFAAGLLYLFNGPLLNPMIAALAMSMSSVSVLLNALRLKRFKPKR